MSAPLLKPAIPATVTTLDGNIGKIVTAIKENVEIMTGLRNGAPKLTQLPAGASTAQIIASINTIIQRLNYQGE